MGILQLHNFSLGCSQKITQEPRGRGCNLSIITTKANQNTLNNNYN